MSIDAITSGTRRQQDGRYLSVSEKEQLLEDIAARQLPQRVIAAQWGISHVQVRKISSDNKDRIAEIRERWDIQAGDESPVPLWVRDKFNRLALRQGALIAILEQQATLREDLRRMELAEDPDGRNDLITLEQYKIVREQWTKLETLKQQILRHVDDVEGQVPSRSPIPVSEGSKMSYTVTGVDVAEVVKQWSNQGAQ